MLQKQTQHLFWRAGFGAPLSTIKEAKRHSAKRIFKRLLKDSESFSPIEVVKPPDTTDTYSKSKPNAIDKTDLARLKEKQLEIEKQRKEDQTRLNIAWIEKMSTGKEVLREKMAFYWHGHLVSRSQDAYYSQSYVNTLRKYALGKFGDLLLAVSKEPSMLQFLNNRQNRKKSPNENFARELMELFTLGRGNYTEKDIKQVARAFTGWDFDTSGQFVFKEKQHDDGDKTIFGKTGNFKGEDVISMILEKKETAIFVTEKIYRQLVNEDTANPWHTEKILKLAERFYESGYEISLLLQHIFTSDWFFDARNIGSHIKSPIELLVGMKTTMQIHFDDPEAPLLIERLLGQILLYPPNVAGWPGGKNWIDSSSLLFRMQLPSLIFTDRQPEISAKSDGDINTEYQTRKRGFSGESDWQKLAPYFAGKKTNLLEEMTNYLLQAMPDESILKEIESRVKAGPQVEAMKKTTMYLWMLPEYQLC
ncbi:DUF1800 domain-containing protein [Emticicia fluvialis]|uniref:DUF1800 domain-containing protein n=1 Tax=Emticicia fluvialis TaxID=2974474 RepID=UPI002165F842|nr:DUF1800 domain-containing protein [Emticicia fluvialis]